MQVSTFPTLAGYKDTYPNTPPSDGEMPLLEILDWVQGDTHAPYPFPTVLEYTLRNAIKGKEVELGYQLKWRKSIEVNPEVITDLGFANDIAWLSEEIEQVQ